MEIYFYFILIQCIAGLEGYFEAHYYDLYPYQKPLHKNLHPHYSVMRTLICVPIMVDLHYTHTNGQLGIFALALVMSYSFFHNGIMYWQRHRLNHTTYPKGFWASGDESLSQAFFELPAWLRISLFILSILFVWGIENSVFYI
jgi:hypothetical protein